MMKQSTELKRKNEDSGDKSTRVKIDDQALEVSGETTFDEKKELKQPVETKKVTIKDTASKKNPPAAATTKKECECLKTKNSFI